MKKILKYPIVIIAVTLIITAFLGIQLKDLVISNDTTIFLPENNPSRVFYTDVAETYDSGNMMIVGIDFAEGYAFRKYKHNESRSGGNTKRWWSDRNRVCNLWFTWHFWNRGQYDLITSMDWWRRWRRMVWGRVFYWRRWFWWRW